MALYLDSLFSVFKNSIFSGYYVNNFQTEATRQLSVEAMAEKIRHDVTEGVEGTDVKCGVIGEVGCQWPLTGVTQNYITI